MTTSSRQPLLIPTCPAPVQDFKRMNESEVPQIESTMYGNPPLVNPYPYQLPHTHPLPHLHHAEQCCDRDLCHCIGKLLECTCALLWCCANFP